MSMNLLDKKKPVGSIVEPSLDNILEVVPSPFIAINMVRLRCNQYNMNLASEQYITLAKLITKVFQEVVEEKITYSY